MPTTKEQAVIRKNKGKTCPELEVEFAQVASLFLVRLTSWIKLSYMSGAFIGLKLEAVAVFLSASGSQRYLIEFIESGGILTLLEILGQVDISDEDKTEALILLLIISNTGQKFKELICESYGVKAIVEYVAKSREENAQERACSLLESLAHGNPRFQGQVYKGLVTLLTCCPPEVQLLVLPALRGVQEIVKMAYLSVVEPVLAVLKSLHLGVQYEALQLIRDLTKYDVREALLRGLVALLKPRREEMQKHMILEEMTELTDSLPVSIQQAAAAKTIRILSQECEELSEASITLEHFVRMSPIVEEQVCKVMGTALFNLLLDDAEAFYSKIDDAQAETLRSVMGDISQATDEAEV
ncbi:hypothetical protein GJAV_G00069680 [Gymnothorax javanicus]|nr:hypothetical protein GJAV_G00069680 [Gymnothorax javanicus]